MPKKNTKKKQNKSLGKIKGTMKKRLNVKKLNNYNYNEVSNELNNNVLEQKMTLEKNPLARITYEELVDRMNYHNELEKQSQIYNAHHHARKLFREKYGYNIDNEDIGYDPSIPSIRQYYYFKEKTPIIKIKGDTIKPANLESNRNARMFLNNNIDLPQGSNNNKQIILILAHGSYCEYKKYRETQLKEGNEEVKKRLLLEKYSAETIPEALQGPKKVQLLSTQTIGRYGYSDFNKLFYNLLKKYDLFHNSILELETQTQANKLNKIYNYFYKLYDYQDSKSKEQIYSSSKLGVKDDYVNITQFRIYPKETKFNNPSNTEIYFWPYNRIKQDSKFYEEISYLDKTRYHYMLLPEQRKKILNEYDDDKILEYKRIHNHEVKGIFDITKKDEYGYYYIDSFIFDNLYEIKKCFFEQISASSTDLEILKFTFLIPNWKTWRNLEKKFSEEQLEIFHEELKFNYNIFEMYKNNVVPKNPFPKLKNEIMTLNEVIERIYNMCLDNKEDLIILDNSCKSMSREPLKFGPYNNKKREFNILHQDLEENAEFDFKKAVSAQREISMSNNEDLIIKKDFTYFYNLYLDFHKVPRDAPGEIDSFADIKDYYNDILEILNKPLVNPQNYLFLSKQRKLLYILENLLKLYPNPDI